MMELFVYMWLHTRISISITYRYMYGSMIQHNFDLTNNYSLRPLQSFYFINNLCTRVHMVSLTFVYCSKSPFLEKIR